jgi:hypothetical protein
MAIINNLDPSFWEDRRFLRWRLMRLNSQYREDVDILWEAFWAWFDNNAVKSYRDGRRSKQEFEIPEEDYEYSLDSCFEKVKDDQTLREYEAIHKNFYPNPEVNFLAWDELIRLSECVEEIWHTRPGGYFIEILNSESYEFDLSHIESWGGPISRAVYDSKREAVLVTGGREEIELNPGRLLWIEPCPIPWAIRFPLSIYLYSLPPWPEKMGRPQYWGLNLLVYELSQTGMKDGQIAHLLRRSASNLLFGNVKSYSDSSDKDPLLVRIADIKMKVKEAVSQAYPF